MSLVCEGCKVQRFELVPKQSTHPWSLPIIVYLFCYFTFLCGWPLKQRPARLRLRSARIGRRDSAHKCILDTRSQCASRNSNDHSSFYFCISVCSSTLSVSALQKWLPVRKRNSLLQQVLHVAMVRKLWSYELTAILGTRE